MADVPQTRPGVGINALPDELPALQRRNAELELALQQARAANSIASSFEAEVAARLQEESAVDTHDHTAQSQRLNALEAELHDMHAAAAARKQEIQTKEAGIKSILAKFHIMRRNRDALQDSVLQLQSKQETTQTALHAAERALRTAQRMEHREDGEEESLRVQREIGARLQALEEKTSGLLTRALDAEQANRELVTARGAERASLEDELDSLTEENEGVIAKYEKVAERLEVRDAEYAELEQELEYKNLRLRKLRERYKEQQSRVATLRRRMQRGEQQGTPNRTARADSTEPGEESVTDLRKRFDAAVAAAESAATENLELRTKIVRLEARLKTERLNVSDLKKQREQDTKREKDRVQRAGRRLQSRIAELEAANQSFEDTIKKMEDSAANAVAKAKEEFQNESGNAKAELQVAKKSLRRLETDLAFAETRLLSVTMQRDELRKKVIVLEDSHQPDDGYQDEWEQDYEAEENEYEWGSEYDYDENEEEEYEWGSEYDDYDEYEQEEDEDAKQERQRYLKFMQTLPQPDDRPSYSTLLPVHCPVKTQDPTLRQNLPNSTLRGIYFPKRTVWCHLATKTHALVFTPTQQYRYPSDKFEEIQMASWCGTGEKFEFFVHRDGLAYYAGTYLMHSMRTLHPPGSTVPPDVSRVAILRAIGLGRENEHRITDCYPDGEVKTECFGLQCVGFNLQLYRAMRENFTLAQSTPAGKDPENLKRKAGAEDLRGSGWVKRTCLGSEISVSPFGVN